MSQTKKQLLDEKRAAYFIELDNQSQCSDDSGGSESDEEKELADLKPVPLKRSVLQSPKKKSKDDHERVNFEELTTKMNLMMKRMEDQDAKVEAKAAAKAEAKAALKVKIPEEKCPEPVAKVNKFKGLF